MELAMPRITTAEIRVHFMGRLTWWSFSRRAILPATAWSLGGIIRRGIPAAMIIPALLIERNWFVFPFLAGRSIAHHDGAGSTQTRQIRIPPSELYWDRILSRLLAAPFILRANGNVSNLNSPSTTPASEAPDSTSLSTTSSASATYSPPP